ncbi:MAG: hypothetical protein COW00_03720 [Bdellovibrio sp. CG12_big_fil_rev_8_21_14_0_65_39_13]|nr:MAG: hypothetical protein COW78_14715 [Bdellovibrio sp. CG22_combo_CG10-13_8_21_14_all_39_27]PIQ61470.1 MAG: hypothetical protein COW00_03720 [Bdellovibrio sp. CG12_big_fil_rev_8_21_14_0_65_39_13]PIR35316.1 MAG: hypothetical protein COV37_09485 [Bdellovibrio sp. CG11_big_fil_rev_8_21_14_0_20_39_38]
MFWELLVFSTFTVFAQVETEVMATPAPTPTPVEKEVEKEVEEFEKSMLEPIISADYKQGEFLIYDCSGHYFACVNDVSFENCRQSREKDIEDKRSVLSCAPLKKFKNQKECFKEQYEQIHQPKNKIFCVNFKNKKKEINQ